MSDELTKILHKLTLKSHLRVHDPSYFALKQGLERQRLDVQHETT